MRVRLAHWYKGSPPGSVVDVAADEVPGLERDGRVAEVLGGKSAAPASASGPAVASADAQLEEGPPEAESPKSRRRGKSDE